jgi:hypothetical protein
MRLRNSSQAALGPDCAQTSAPFQRLGQTRQPSLPIHLVISGRDYAGIFSIEEQAIKRGKSSDLSAYQNTGSDNPRDSCQNLKTTMALPDLEAVIGAKIKAGEAQGRNDET